VRFRLAILACLAAFVLLLLPVAALAWSNGPSGANGFGTHDWVLKEANRLAATKSAGWVRLSAALHHTDDPDTVFHDTYYHCYDVWGSRYGNAPKKVAEYYARALAARKAGNWTAASRYVGLMAHYYADICNPMHTDQCAAEESIHSSYESAAQDYTDSPGENRGWVRFNGYDAATNVVGRVKATAAASHKQYTALVNNYSANGMSAGVMSITHNSMNRAANGLADLIISIQRKVNGGTTASGGGGGGGSSGTTVYITRTGEKYHRGSCGYLSQSKIAISLADAKARGYGPCSVCRPPT